MKNRLIAASILTILVFSGCQQLQNQANDLSQQGEQTMNGLSQQAIDIKKQALATKAQFDEKSQEAVNTMNDFNKLTK